MLTAKLGGIWYICYKQTNTKSSTLVVVSSERTAYNFNSRKMYGQIRVTDIGFPILQGEIEDSMGITLPDIDGDIDDEY